ncbi:MAG TPA: citrate transporter [Anaerolineae bacterium]|nr:citrate transporter [Anaerolineae bacterium]
MSVPAVFASLIFFASLILIYTDKINRTIVALAGAALMLVVGQVLQFYDLETAIQVIDFETLGLLMSMMILFAMLEPTGLFEYLAVLAARASRGSPLRLFILLGAITAAVSMFLNNVTTVVLIAPVTILICAILGISAVPYLLAEALFSNIGGVATLVGDPPNVLIGSAVGLTFNDFIFHSLPVAVMACIGGMLLLSYLFREELSKKPQNADSVMGLNPAESLNQPETARRVLIVLGAAILLFFVHHLLGIGPAFVSIVAMSVALIWVRPDMEEALKRVEWNVLLFFGGLFVMVGGLEYAGVLDIVLGLLEGMSHIDPVWFGVIIIWMTAILSAIVDNIPITIALIPIIQGLSETGMNITPLWWALAFGVGFGGNGTIIGSTAGIIVASLSEKTKAPITPRLWNQRGLPVMVVTCIIASVMFVILYETF